MKNLIMFLIVCAGIGAVVGVWAPVMEDPGRFFTVCLVLDLIAYHYIVR